MVYGTLKGRSMTVSKLKPHPIPDAALDADIAILGKKGRTFTAKGVVERLLHMQRRVIILDPLSVWWGLKSGTDGRALGFHLPVFAGRMRIFRCTMRRGLLSG